MGALLYLLHNVLWSRMFWWNRRFNVCISWTRSVWWKL